MSYQLLADIGGTPRAWYSLEHTLYLTVYCTQELYVRHSSWILVFHETVVEQNLSRVSALENTY